MDDNEELTAALEALNEAEDRISELEQRVYELEYGAKKALEALERVVEDDSFSELRSGIESAIRKLEEAL